MYLPDIQVRYELRQIYVLLIANDVTVETSYKDI